jgi:hypothetical protein
VQERRTYCDDRLNVGHASHLVPDYTHGVLTGLRAGPLFIPRPVLGVEHENNLAAKLPLSERRMSDAVGVRACLQAAASLGAKPARGRFSRCDCGPCDRGRLLLRGPEGLPIHLYNDLSKLELAFGEFTAAKRLLAVEAALAPILRDIVALAGWILGEQYGADTRLLLHCSGGDGNTTCASAHLNIPWSDAVSRAAYVSLEAFDHLQEMLVRQLAIMTSVAATGMPAENGMLSDPRSNSFAHIVGQSTLEPNRAMQYDRLQGRPDEGYDRQGCGRNMGMCVAWGQSQVGNFLSLTLNQLETLRFHLAVAGLYSSPKLLRADDNLLTLAAELGTNRTRAAELQRRAVDDYTRLTSFLTAEVGEEVLEELVPDHQEALRLADMVLTALEQGDQDTLVRTTDYGKKMLLADRYLSGRGGSWRENLQGVRNICFAFASPQEISPYYSYFRCKDLEMSVLGDEDLRGTGPDPLTRSFFFSKVLSRFWNDPLLDCVEFDWDRLVLRRSSTWSGGWIPKIRTEEKTVLLPGSVGHNAPALADLFDTQIYSLDDVFDIFGTAPSETATIPT